LRVFNSGNAPRRDGEHLGNAVHVLENGDARLLPIAQIDGHARHRPFAPLLVRDTLLVHDFP